jgi:hypothetical protein
VCPIPECRLKRRFARIHGYDQNRWRYPNCGHTQEEVHAFLRTEEVQRVEAPQEQVDQRER